MILSILLLQITFSFYRSTQSFLAVTNQLVPLKYAFFISPKKGRKFYCKYKRLQKEKQQDPCELKLQWKTNKTQWSSPCLVYEAANLPRRYYRILIHCKVPFHSFKRQPIYTKTVFW